MKSIIYKVILFTLVLNIAGCGYFSDDPLPSKEVYNSEDLRASCKLNTQELQNIFKEDVSHQIDCLEENFNNFIKYVKRERTNAVSELELQRFVRKFFKVNTDSFLNGLRFLFELNMILLNDQNDFISTDNVKPLFKIMQKTNKHAVKIYQLFMKTDELTYLIHRDEIFQEFQSLMSSILEIVKDKDSKIINLNILEFLSNINEKFPDFTVNLKAAESLLFIKKLFLGGPKNILTSIEVKQLLVKSPKLFEIGMDLFFLNEKSFKENKELYTHYRRIIEQTRSLFFPLNDRSTLFKTEDLIEALTDISFSTWDLKKAEKIINSFQTNLLGNSSEFFSFKDLRVGMHYLEILTTMVPYQVKISKQLVGIKEKEYFYKKSIISDVTIDMTELSEELMKLLQFNIEFPNEQNLLAFILDVNKELTNDYNIPNDVLKSFFSAKTLLLGGSKETVQKNELIAFIKKSPKVLQTILRFLYIENKDLYNDSLKYQYYLELGKSFSNLLFKTDKLTGEDEVVLMRSELIQIIDYLTKNKESFNIHSYIESIDRLKVKVLGGSKEHYMISEIRQLTEMMVEVIENTLYFNETYKANERIFKRSSKITFIPKKNLAIYSKIDSSRLEELYQSFSHQAKVFRYYRGENGVAYYNSIIKRTRKGFVESSLVNSIFKVLQKAYGTIDQNNNIKFDKENLQTMFRDFKPVLVKLDMWTMNFDNFVRNILLLSDLFQNTSNGTGVLELDETTEFGVLVLQTMKLSHEVFNELKVLEDNGQAQSDGVNCHYQDPNAPVFSVLCHRHYFFDIFFNKLNHKKDFPKFFKFYQNSTEEELNNFLKHIEGFSREYEDPEQPIAARDYGMIIGSLLNIESTFIRFDKDEDNVLNNTELDQAFVLYKDAIISLAKLSGSQVKYAKSIFLYMVKYMQVPSKIQLLNFHYNPFASSEVVAKRLNLGALLYYLVKK